VTKHFHVFIPCQWGAKIIVLYVHHHHDGVLGGEGAVNPDVAGVIESVAAHGQADTFLFFLVWFVVTNSFAISDFSVFWDVGEFDKETYVGSRNVPNALE
jgi:hypothetical protein